MSASVSKRPCPAPETARVLDWMLSLLFAVGQAAAAVPPDLSPEVRQFVSIEAPVVALTHVRLIDGTGAPAREDETILITAGRITAVGSGVAIPPEAKVLELSGRTVFPGLVGMHDHLFFPQGGGIFSEMGVSFPRLYLAAGVTTIRTTGSIEPYTDLEIQKQIDSGRTAGPKIHVTGPYLEGEGSFTPQLHTLTGNDDARKTVAFWADQGATSFKAYMHITREELGEAIAEAHRRGRKLTGHLCSVTYPEAIALGIDDFEHGPIFTDTEFAPDKKADQCPVGSGQAPPSYLEANARLDVAGPGVEKLTRDLVAHGVAVTSTLPVFELQVPGRPPLRDRVLESMAPHARLNYLERRARVGSGPGPAYETLFRKELQFEHAFVAAGGRLLAGCDPTGIGGVLAGFGDQRELELLVEAGFSPLEAIRIGTRNGAEFLGESSRIGTIATGKQADLVVVRGDPSVHISDIENVEIVFKDGIGYDPTKLVESVRGLVGMR